MPAVVVYDISKQLSLELEYRTILRPLEEGCNELNKISYRWAACLIPPFRETKREPFSLENGGRVRRKTLRKFYQ